MSHEPKNTASQSRELREALSAQLRSWSGAGLLSFVLIALATVYSTEIGAGLVILWLWLSCTSPKEVGLVRPRNWFAGLVVGVLLGLAMKLVMKAIVLPLLGAPAMNPAFHGLIGNGSALWATLPHDIFRAGICEEIVFRGYLFERINRLAGKTTHGAIIALLVSSSIFGALHFQQGLMGIENGFVTGLMFGLIYLWSRRTLYTAMVAHAIFDVATSFIIYLNLESAVSHLFF